MKQKYKAWYQVSKDNTLSRQSSSINAEQNGLDYSLFD